ncbi:MAG: hypothetical protein OEQ29_15675 [Alphaproteobacteria bacterium]|nr:hypothetical protein [Alphaproteobacteria bacterium]
MLLFPSLAAAGPMEDSTPLPGLESSFARSQSEGQDGYDFTNRFDLRLGSQSLLLDLVDDAQVPLPGSGTSNVAPDAIFDFYPFQNVFRLSGGFLYDADPFESPTEAQNNQITLGGLPFTPSGNVAAPSALDFNAYRPYAGLGAQSSFWSGHLQFSLDFGLQYDSESSTNEGGGNAAAAGSDNSKADLEDLEFLGFSPRAGVSVKLQF